MSGQGEAGRGGGRDLAATFLRVRLCRWTTVGFKLPSGRLSTRWRFYHCRACSTTRKAKAQPPCPLDALRAARPREEGSGR